MGVGVGEGRRERRGSTARRRVREHGEICGGVFLLRIAVVLIIAHVLFFLLIFLLRHCFWLLHVHVRRGVVLLPLLAVLLVLPLCFFSLIPEMGLFKPPPGGGAPSVSEMGR